MKNVLEHKLFLIFIVLFPLCISINSWAGGSIEQQIEELKMQLEEVKRQSQQQIEALRGRIEELEAKQEKMPEKMKEGWWDNVEVGYKKGAFIKMKDESWALKFNTRLQFRFFIEDFDDERDKDTKASFQLRRARLYFSGHGFFPWLKYKIQIQGDKGSNLGLKDYYLDFAYYKEATPRIGQFKLPFNAEELTSSSALQFVDRSIVNSEFALSRDIGVMLHGKVLGDLFHYGAGIFNGGGRNIKENADDDFLFVGRVAFTPFGYFKYQQAHLEKHSNKMLLRIGAAIAGLPGFEPDKETTSDRKNLGNAVADIGSAKADVVQFSADAVFKWMRFSIEAEYDLRNIYPEEGGIGDVTAHGFRVQAGYLIIPKHLEVAFRYAFLDPDDDRSNDRIQEFTPAISYYVRGHRLKVQADYTILLEDNPDGDDFMDNIFKLQMQFYF